jgi:hypothetical protein
MKYPLKIKCLQMKTDSTGEGDGPVVSSKHTNETSGWTAGSESDQLNNYQLLTQSTSTSSATAYAD